ncbi:MAG TPA: hypothetical protein VGA18_07855 [Rhodothermales bacterium]|jgi:hypothetical protein
MNRGEHSETETVHLEDSQCVDVVLVPLDEGAVGHGGVFDGDHFAERPAGDDETADVLGEVSRETDNLSDEFGEHAHGAVVGVQAGLAEEVGADVHAVPPFVLLGEGVDVIEREAQGLADVADGGARAVGDDLGDDAGVLAAVLVVDVLQDFFAAFVLEVDVDVRGLVAFGADEALEEEVDAVGIDAGDAQAVTDGGVGRTAAALAEDVLGAGEGDDVPDGQEVGLVLQLADELQLVLDEPSDFLGNTGGVTIVGPGPGQLGEEVVRVPARRAECFGILVAQLVEAEAAAIGDLDGAGQGVGVIDEQALHVIDGLEVAFGVGEEGLAGLGEGAAVADAGENVLEEAALWDVVVSVVGCDQRHARGARERIH